MQIDINLVESLHDTPMEGFKVDYSTNTLEIFILIFDEIVQDYQSFCVSFSRVTRLGIQDFFADDFEDMEIYSCDIESGVLRKKLIKITILTGFGKQSILISFEFDDVVIRPYKAGVLI